MHEHLIKLGYSYMMMCNGNFYLYIYGTRNQSLYNTDEFKFLFKYSFCFLLSIVRNIFINFYYKLNLDYLHG